MWATSWQNQQNGICTQQRLRVFAVHMKKAWVLSYPLNAQRRLWSDWADAQANLSLHWAHSHFVLFVMRWLMYYSKLYLYIITVTLQFSPGFSMKYTLYWSNSMGTITHRVVTNTLCRETVTKSQSNAPVICNHCPPPHLLGWTGDSGANVWGSDLSEYPRSAE